ncbi:ATP-binding protein [Halomonas sp. AOP13-D3-9]
MSKIANAHPTKSFFVTMLTRDIELKDALLDLLDNCVDGALRKTKDDKIAEKPYDGFYCNINLSEDEISIIDNCGGISKEIAENYAFRMGRENAERDSDIATVGMYGIGMKRAFFKIGNAAKVSTQTDNDYFSVTIPDDWIENNDWHFDIEDHDKKIFDENGTTISIKSLHKKVKEQIFAEDSEFEEELITEISTHFAYIMQKGFSFNVNGYAIAPKTISFALSESIKPYIYEAIIDDISVSMVIGFRDPMISEEDEEKEKRVRYKKEDAGWTVICNERVVLLNDKSRMTGWGDADIPQYHSQFITISGILEFKSTKAEQLPLTTTKRGLDANSDIYLYIKRFMREGMKILISYTNNWKSHREEERQHYINSEKLSAKKIIEQIKAEESNKFGQPQNKFNSTSKVEQNRFLPTLPTPDIKNKVRVIKYTKDINEIKLLGEFLFEDPEAPASEIGKLCFERVLKEYT